MTPEIGIVVLNWREDEITRTCLNSLRQQQGIALRVVLVENECNESAFTANDRFEIIENPVNMGFCHAVNQGLRALARHQPHAYVLLNNDVTFASTGELSKLYKRLQSDPRSAAVAPQVVHKDKHNTLLHAWGSRRWLLAADWVGGGDHVSAYPEAKIVEMLNAACLMIHPRALRDVGLWDEAYFIYYDDMDWTLRASKNGLNLWYEPAATVRHAGSYTMQKHASFSEYSLTRGRFIFMRRHGSFHQWPAFLLGMAATLLKPALKDLLRLRKPALSVLRFKAYLDGLRLRLPPLEKL